MSAAPVLVPRPTLAEHIGEVDRIIELVELLDEAEELTPSRREELQVALIESLAGTRKKVDDTGCALAQFDAAIAAAQAEEERLRTRRKYFERQKERLETYVLAVLSASHLPRIEGNTSTLAARLNPPSVEIDPEAKLPPALLRFPPPPAPVPDKASIALALKAGAAVPGCRLVQKTRLVRS